MNCPNCKNEMNETDSYYNCLECNYQLKIIDDEGYEKKIKKKDGIMSIKSDKKFKDYPTMKFISEMFSLFAILTVIVGIIIIVRQLTMSDLDGYLQLVSIVTQIFGTAGSWLFFKFSAESVIILCDIAYYLKSINEKK